MSLNFRTASAVLAASALFASPTLARADGPSGQGASTAAAAPESSASASGASTSFVLQPREIDARASMQTDVTLAYLGLGASVDVGMTKLGPGTLALGGGLEYDFCWSTCWSAPMNFSEGHLWPQFRATYHMELPRIGYLDFYPVVTAGPVISRASIQLDNSTRYRGSDVGVGVGMGAGASYFITRSIFMSGEAKIRYAAGTYNYEIVNGVDRPFDRSRVDSWSMSGIDATVALGARF